MNALRQSLDACRRLVLADVGAEKVRLENELGTTQAEVVSEFIETTCWGDVVPHLVGKRGTPDQRLVDLRLAFEGQK